ncbi:MAG TPA: alkaline phosphatase family protein [Pyrinomonadaceae bacterium]
MPKTLRDAIIAVSLANLCFIAAWRVLLNPLHFTYYHWKYYQGFTEYIALMIDVLALATLFWGAATLARRSGRPAVQRVARWAFLLALVVPINDLRMQFLGSVFNFRKSLLIVLVALSVVAAAAAAAWRWGAYVVRAAVALVLVLSPFVLIALAQGAWFTYKHRTNAALAVDRPAGPLPQPAKLPGARVVWIVFDEMDQGRAFVKRPEGLDLPEFDRLRREAVFAENALPPSSHTLLSMPSLISGQQIEWALAVRPNELLVTARGSTEQVAWSTQPNVFAEARAAGVDTAIAGWYHPYCRVIGASLSSCFWEPVVLNEVSPLRGRPTIWKSMGQWATLSLSRIPGAFRLLGHWYERSRRQDHIEEQSKIMERARAIAKERGFGLALLHFPVPHSPFIYDRAGRALSDGPAHTYADNLALADRTLGDLRRDTEAAGLWDDTAIIVSSDHWWRDPPDGQIDQRVPFIVKLPGQREGSSYAKPFNTVVTRALILALLRGEVTDPPGLVRWLDQNRSEVQPVSGITVR